MEAHGVRMGEIRSMRKYCTVACWCSLYTGMGGVELKNKSILRNYIFLTKKNCEEDTLLFKSFVQHQGFLS